MDAPQDPLGDASGAGPWILPQGRETAARQFLVPIRVAPAQLVDAHRPQIVEPAHHAVLGCSDSIRFLKFRKRPGSCCSASMRSTMEGTSAPSLKSIL